MPAGAPISKVEATRGYGAEVVLVPGVYDDAAAEAERLTKEQGYTFAHPFNDPLVIAGQGTIGLEILEQLPDVEQIVVPIGGGGLIGGIAFAVKQLKPDCRIVGVQAVRLQLLHRKGHCQRGRDRLRHPGADGGPKDRGGGRRRRAGGGGDVRQGGHVGEENRVRGLRRQCGRDHAVPDHHQGPVQGRADRRDQHEGGG